LKSTSQNAPAPGVPDPDLVQRLSDCQLFSEATARELLAFGATLSHDLRAPLRSIEGFSGLLLQAPYLEQLDETGQDYLQRIHRASLRLSQMMNELLQLVRLAQDGVKSELVDLSALAQDILAGLRATAPTRAVEIEVEPAIAVTGDARLLRLVLQNLLGNAWKFTGASDPANIFLGRVVDQGVPAICVRDNGVGFEQKYADKLFRAFSRLHSETAFAGLGMGLAQAQRAIHAHGGRIWGRAQRAGGASFYFTLPHLAMSARNGTEGGKRGQ
jgi:signal transduction histidine kinase